MKNMNLLGEIYENSIDIKIRKSNGQYYTPNFIIDYIMEKTIGNVNIVDNPFVSVIDISCGAGYFLFSAYDILQKKISENIDNLKERYKGKKYMIEMNGEIKVLSGKEYWKKENIHYHILKSCIYGADKDLMAVNLTIKGLREKEVDINVGDLNIVQCDSLVYWEDKKGEEFEKLKINVDINKLREFWSKKYDYVIGNPPYIGHKQLSMDYKKWLLEEYGDVFKDKSDISFCFFKKIHDILAPKGVSGIISSRYFMESPTGKNLRKYFMKYIDIIEIVDFYGSNVFKDAGIATAIYIFKDKNLNDSNEYIDIHKLQKSDFKLETDIDIDEMINSGVFESFKFQVKKLNSDRWMIISDEYYDIYKRIQEKADLKLEKIAVSFQGIITGCDKAFVISGKEILDCDIERKLIKPWIKNKNIEKYKITKDDMYLIYGNNIDNPELYPNSIKFMEKHKNKLAERRECKRGIRRWYDLQWGRKESLFEQEKIIFPYKSKTNRFSIDLESLYFSADIYGLVLRDEYKDQISLEYLIGLLNSSVYEFYFKLFAKKIGRDIYDYYPNSLLSLNIILGNIASPIEKLVAQILNGENTGSNIQMEIDYIIMDYLDFSEKEKKIIQGNIL